jgi:hypothetical protein
LISRSNYATLAAPFVGNRSFVRACREQGFDQHVFNVVRPLDGLPAFMMWLCRARLTAATKSKGDSLVKLQEETSSAVKLLSGEVELVGKSITTLATALATALQKLASTTPAQVIANTCFPIL